VAYLFDILFLGVIFYAGWYGYTRGLMGVVYEVVKLMIIFALATRYGLSLGIGMQTLGIIAPESFGVLLLIGFLLGIALAWSGFYLLEEVFSRLPPKFQSLKQYGNVLITTLTMTLLFALGVFLVMQLKPMRLYVQPVLMKSISYPVIRRASLKLLSPKFVRGVVMEGGSKMSGPETIVKMLGEQF